MYYITMKDRLAIYGVILVALYIGTYIWNQKEGINLLKEQIIEYDSTLKKQRELINAQEEYIKFLERGSLPFYRDRIPKYNQPI